MTNDDALTADEMLRMTDPIRTEIREDGWRVYVHTTGAMWINLFCTQCDHRLRGVTPPMRGPATRSRWCSRCRIYWVLLVTPLGVVDDGEFPRRAYRVQWAEMERR